MRLSRYLHAGSRSVKWATSNQPWKGSLEMISWQGFEQGKGLIGFGAMKQQSSSTMSLCQAESTILIRGSKGGEIRQNDNLVQNLARKRNPSRNLHKRRFEGDYELTSRCIAFGIPVASSYAQSNNITSKQENLITTSIQSWLRPAVSKFNLVLIYLKFDCESIPKR
jgi:hypothetical protein